MHTPTLFDPDARAPRFERFIREIFSDNAELIDFVHRAIGYSISGDTSEECAFFCWGTGRNGKSKLLTTLRAALGDYAHNMPFSALELNTRSAIPSDVAALAGRRFVSASEITEGFRLNEARLKALTGNDPISARFMYEDFFTFRPVAKYWLAVNHKPVVLDDSTGFWSRVRLIPFLRQFTGNDADKNLEASLLAEAPGILTWVVRGCLEWQRRGLTPPQIVTDATTEYREESDPLGAFIIERCVVGDMLQTAAGELYKAYRTWAEDRGASGREILSEASFGRRMGTKFRKTKGARSNIYHGLGVRVDG